jgi:hypothetical protein
LASSGGRPLTGGTMSSGVIGSSVRRKPLAFAVLS